MKRTETSVRLYVLIGALVFLIAVQLYLPTLALYHWPHQAVVDTPFPVTVDPRSKTITESPAVEELLSRENSPLTAAVIGAADFFDLAAAAVAASPAYRAVVAADPPRAVVIYPGYRKEQVAAAFASALNWDKTERAAFLSGGTSTPQVREGWFFPGTYLVEPDTTVADVHERIQEKFQDRVLSRYATSTRAVVPLNDALVIASLLEREAGNTDEMRLISGIIWNRLFLDMPLQIDSTLQYARGSARNGWWPVPRSKDKYLNSPFNTYLNKGLPPSPIANASVSAVIAALNPKKTDCIFFFHDAVGDFHCSATYAEHVTLLKQYFGRGK